MVIAAGVWLSSGTLAPYAATLEKPRIDKPCNYLINSDHAHFQASFLMLDGAPREQWDFSIYLRRILYPLLAYPLMKVFGFLAGGVMTSAILQLAAFVTFVIYIRKKIGDVAAYAAIILVAFYPGIYYWAGLPYNHVMIVPASLLGVLLIREIELGETIRRVGICALLLGVLFLAYDLLPLFAPPVIFILLLRRRPRFVHAAVAAVMLVLPTLLTNAILDWRYGLAFRNKNTQTYFDMLQGYLHPSNLPQWGRLVSRAPLDFVATFFFSNFWFLPALFVAILIVNRCTIRLKMTGTEKWLLVTTLLLFAFINLAPPTPGWQFRGSGMARIYQPAFAAMILFAARWMQAAWNTRRTVARRITIVLAAATLANAIVIFGPAFHIGLADRVYLSFYRHAETLALSKNLDTFGRRPLGFCNTRLKIENPLSKR
ncbi:MAG: hypothetical protein QOF78_3091, partial [Phycisphaerales bacterium]|nr:hypothetical protein [Phycisphaerales bacterium]